MRKATSLAGVLMLLAACDGAGTGGKGQPAATAQDAASTAAEAAPSPGELKTFGDWAVGCDNVATCKAAALAPEGGEFPAVLMSFTRAAGPNGAMTVAFLSSEAIPLPLRIAVDGKPIGEGGRTDDDATRIEGDLARRIVAAAADGRTLSVADGGNASTSTISLAGLAAALRYVDEKQGRSGTTGALVARGSATQSGAAPAAPVVTALTPGGTAVAPSPEQLAQFRKSASCDDELAANSAQPGDVHALGGGKTLLLLPCSAGAYNVTALVYVSGEGGFQPARFDIPPGMGEGSGIANVVNGQWQDGILTSFDKGRGVGDCGVSAAYAWDGTRFRLVEQAAMSECRGNTDYIRTWHAEVRRR
ncbi:MAG TPA: DUF1176 domain-containing protein [Allosphingosinicella sp.]|nr:DUF1176 domain-containing protein [Allosphingosinicella sp.]